MQKLLPKIRLTVVFVVFIVLACVPLVVHGPFPVTFTPEFFPVPSCGLNQLGPSSGVYLDLRESNNDSLRLVNTGIQPAVLKYTENQSIRYNYKTIKPELTEKMRHVVLVPPAVLEGKCSVSTPVVGHCPPARGY